MLTEGTQLRTAVVYGGVGYNAQLEAFRGGAQLVVGTPGRILDHLLKNTLSLDHLKMLIFDEADRMLSMGFYPDMVKIRKYIPVGRITSSMFSATFPPQVIRLAGQFLHDPQLLSLSGNEVHIAESEHIYYIVPGMRKERSLVRIIEIENPASAIIFCNTKDTVHYLSVVLKRFGYDADELSSDLARAQEKKSWRGCVAAHCVFWLPLTWRRAASIFPIFHMCFSMSRRKIRKPMCIVPDAPEGWGPAAWSFPWSRKWKNSRCKALRVFTISAWRNVSCPAMKSSKES